MTKTAWVNWRGPLAAGAVTTMAVLGLFYYWFGVADRYRIFLYGHHTTNIPGAEPFDAITSSRYWMAGLVAAGVVLVAGVIGGGLWGWIAARTGRPLRAAAWRRVWLVCALPIGLGVPLITMTVNTPTLPLMLASACGAAALLGLVPALAAGQWAVERPAELLWLAADGAALMPTLMFLRALELPGRGLSVSPAVAGLFAAGSVLAGLGGLALLSGLRRWRRRATPGAGAVLAAGLGLSDVVMPLVHHLLGTPAEYRYITAASNFFAFNPGLQALAVLIAAGLAAGAVWARRRFHRLAVSQGEAR